MIKEMLCPVCGSSICFSYIIPIKSYRIENGKIERDDAWTGPGYDDPYLDFHCSMDSEHDISSSDMLEWMEKVEAEFYKNYKEQNI